MRVSLRDTPGHCLSGAKVEVDFVPIISYAPEGPAILKKPGTLDLELLPQTSADLSQRLHHATAYCLTVGGCDEP
jgi:hypothetical protein